MAIEAEVYNALTTSSTLAGLVSTRIYPIVLLQGTEYPAVVYRRASGDRYYDMSGYSTLENVKIELTICATAVTARRITSDAAIGALSSATAFTGLVIESPMDTWNDEVQVYQRTYDISIWYQG